MYLELKYINLLSNRLEKFKRKSQYIYNFRCPYCKDSENNPNKARGYIYEKKNSLWYHCHNCGINRAFKNFLKDIDLGLYTQYLKELLTDNSTKESEYHKTSHKVNIETKDIFSNLQKISQLSHNHFAKKYIVERKIPNKYHAELYYTDDFQGFVNNLLPGKLSGKSEPRIIIPFITYGKTVVGFQGRELKPSNKKGIKYITINLNDGVPKVYGMHHVNLNKPIRVVEGPFDSMFLYNAIAITGSEFAGPLLQLNLSKNNVTCIFDNEPRNKEIVGNMQGIIDKGYSICIWPSNIKEKDINEMIKNGYTSSQLGFIIDSNTKKGLAAKLALNAWKQI